MNSNGFSSVVIIKKFFAPIENREIMELDKTARVQLASAAAREMKISQEECSFEFVEY